MIRNRNRNIVRAPWVLAAAILATACGDDEGPTTPEPPPPDPPRATAISVSPPSVTLTAIGETATFTASVTDQNGQPFTGTAPTWASGAPDVFTVDQGGVVTAVANGSGTLTAAVGNVSAHRRGQPGSAGPGRPLR